MAPIILRMMTKVSRPLSEAEGAWFRERARKLRDYMRSIRIVGVVCSVFALGTLLVFIHNVAITGLAVVGTGAFIAWLLLLSARDMWEVVRCCEDLARSGSAVELRVQSNQCFLVCAFDQEADHNFFDVGDQGTAVVNDQNGLHNQVFTPVNDFTVVQFYNHAGGFVDERIVSSGELLEPLSVIQRKSYETLPESYYQNFSLIPRSFDAVLAEQSAENEVGL